MPRVVTIPAFVTMLVLSTASWAQALGAVADNLHEQLDPSFVNHDQDQILGFLDLGFVSINVHGARHPMAEFRTQMRQLLGKTGSITKAPG